MIKYNLTCECKYAFDSWFNNSSEFERLRKKKLILCIQCHSYNVKKSIMAPNISNLKKNNNDDYTFQKNIKKKIVEYQKFIKENCKYVGENFAQEARNIHYGDKETKGIYGKGTSKEIEDLREEGIETFTVPWYDKKEN